MTLNALKTQKRHIRQTKIEFKGPEGHFSLQGQSIPKLDRVNFQVQAKAQVSSGNVIATVFRYFKGFSHIDFLQDHQTVNTAFYRNLLAQVKLSCWRKRCGFSVRNVLLIHDNACSHKANLTHEKLERMFQAPAEHLPYSPDLSPYDYNTHV